MPEWVAWTHCWLYSLSRHADHACNDSIAVLVTFFRLVAYISNHMTVTWQSHDSHMTVTWQSHGSTYIWQSQLPFSDLHLRKVYIFLPPEDIKLISIKHTATLVQKRQPLLLFSLLLWPLPLNPRPHFLQGCLISCPKRSNKNKSTCTPLRPLMCTVGLSQNLWVHN